MAKCEYCGKENPASAEFCQGCGARLRPEAVPAPVHTKPAEEEQAVIGKRTEKPLPASGRVCPHCGRPVTEKMKFCRSCGQRLSDSHPAEKKSRRTGNKAAEGKKGRSVPVRLLAVCLAVIFIVTAFWQPGFVRHWFSDEPDPMDLDTLGSLFPRDPQAGQTGGDETPAESDGEETGQSFAVAFENPADMKIEKTEEFTLTEEESTVTTKGGIVIDFRSANEVAGEPIRVDSFRRREDADFIQTAVEIDMGEHHEFLEPIDVTIPYDSSAAEGKGKVWMERYDPELESWYPVPCDVDAEKGTVTAHLTHLSPPLRAIIAKEKDHPYARYMTQPLQLSASGAKAVMESLTDGKKEGASLGLTKIAFLTAVYGGGCADSIHPMLLQGDFTDRKVMRKALAAAQIEDQYLDRAMDTISWFSGVVESADSFYNPMSVLHMSEGTVVSTMAKSVSEFCTYLSAASLIYDIASHMDDPEYISGKWGDVAKWTYYTGTGATVGGESLGGALLSCSMMGVMAIDWSLNALALEGQKLHRDRIFQAMCYYYDTFDEPGHANREHNWFHPESGRRRGSSRWDEIVLAAVANSRNQEDLKERLESWMRSYTQDFFDLDPEVMRLVWSDSGNGKLGSATMKNIYESDVEPLRERYMQLLAQKLGPSMEKAMKAVRCGMLDVSGQSRAAMLRLLEKKLTFELFPGKAKDTELFAGATVCLTGKDGVFRKGMAIRLDEHGKAERSCTLRQYAAYGIPQTCMIWAKGKNPAKEAPDYSVEFAFQPEGWTKIPLSPLKLDGSGEVGDLVWQVTDISYMKPPENALTVSAEPEYIEYDWADQPIVSESGYTTVCTYEFGKGSMRVHQKVTDFVKSNTDDDLLGVQREIKVWATGIKKTQKPGSIMPIELHEQKTGGSKRRGTMPGVTGFIAMSAGINDEYGLEKVLRNRSSGGATDGYVGYRQDDRMFNSDPGIVKVQFPEIEAAGEKVYVCVSYQTEFTDGKHPQMGYTLYYHYKTIYEYTAVPRKAAK